MTMTCTHLLDLIDAGPLADYPRDHLDAAWAHARQCATCGRAWDAATALTAGLRALPQPTPPARMAAAVLARIAQIEPTGPVSVVLVPENRRRTHARDWPALAIWCGGFAAALALVLSTRLGDAAAGATLPTFRTVAPGVITLPMTTAEALTLAAGLLLYVVGMFAPLADGRRTEQGLHDG